MKKGIVGLSAILAAACTTAPGQQAETVPPPGSNEMLRAGISGIDGYEVIISDVVIPAGATVPRHYHPGEEFVYVISGSAIHVEQGKPDVEIKAGDGFVIEPKAIHAPRGGPDGARAIVFRVHVADQPERILVDEAHTQALGEEAGHHH